MVGAKGKTVNKILENNSSLQWPRVDGKYLELPLVHFRQLSKGDSLDIIWFVLLYSVVIKVCVGLCAIELLQGPQVTASQSTNTIFLMPQNQRFYALIILKHLHTFDKAGKSHKIWIFWSRVKKFNFFWANKFEKNKDFFFGCNVFLSIALYILIHFWHKTSRVFKEI